MVIIAIKNGQESHMEMVFPTIGIKPLSLILLY